MAYPPHSRNLMAELGGKHMQDHRLVLDTPYSVQSSHKRSTSSDNAVPQTTTRSGSSGGQATSDEAMSEDDEEEDSSNSQDDEEDEPEVFAPSHGRGKGKGKRPSIRVEPADEEGYSEDEADAPHETGPKPNKHPISQLLMSNKKRTFSNVSNTSVLFGDDQSDEHAFPRRKMARKLSNSGLKPLLKYKEDANGDMEGFENAIETDDEDYSGVNLVPDDDEFETNFEEEEESYIIREEEEQATALISQYNDARRLSLDSHASDDIFNLTTPLTDPFGNPSPTLDFTQFFEPEALPASPDPNGKRKYSDSSTKRVRFDDEVQISESSSPSSSELDSSLYPDLFLEQDKLPPSLTQLLLEQGNDEDNGDYDSPASELSFWDFGQEDDEGIRHEKVEGLSDLSDSDASGYESDMGDTTDEYDSDMESLGNPHTPTPKKSVLNPPSSMPGSKASSPKPFQRSSSGYGRAIPPTRGIFIHDDQSKAIAVTNRTTKTLTFYRPRVSTITWVSAHGSKSSSSSTANNSPRTALHNMTGSDSEVSNEVFSNACTTDIMLTGLFGAAPDSTFRFRTDCVGPPEAFYPYVSIGANGLINEDDIDFDDEDSQDDLNIADFMDFGDDADDTDVEQEDEETDVPATPATSMLAMNGSTPAQETPMADTPVPRKRNTSDAMLQHFDRGVVTAFRNNQNRYRDLSCLPSDPTIRASVSRPVRSGKSAEAVMTPLRKRSVSKRVAKSPFQKSSPMANASSPLSGVTKASSRLHNQVMNAREPPKMGTFS